LNKESRMLSLFWMGAPGCAESRSSPWKTREVVDFRPAGEVPATARLIVLQCRPRYKGSSSSLPKLSCRRNQTTSRSKCVGSNRLTPTPPPGWPPDVPRTKSQAPLLRLACRSLVPCLDTTHNNFFPPGTGRSRCTYLEQDLNMLPR
jgi:hypothetical protein